MCTCIWLQVCLVDNYGRVSAYDLQTGKPVGESGLAPVPWPAGLEKLNLTTSAGQIVGAVPRESSSAAAIATAACLLDPLPLLLVCAEDGVMTAIYTRPSCLKGQVAFMLMNWNAQQLPCAVTSVAFSFNECDQVNAEGVRSDPHQTPTALVTGDATGVVKVWPLAALLDALHITPVPIAVSASHTTGLESDEENMPPEPLAPGQKPVRRCDMLLKLQAQEATAHRGVAPPLSHILATVYPASCLLGHVEGVRSVAILGTCKTKAIVSIGDDHRVLLWSFGGVYLGALMRRDPSEPGLHTFLTSLELPSLFPPAPPAPSVSLALQHDGNVTAVSHIIPNAMSSGGSIDELSAALAEEFALVDPIAILHAHDHDVPPTDPFGLVADAKVAPTVPPSEALAKFASLTIETRGSVISFNVPTPHPATVGTLYLFTSLHVDGLVEKTCAC